MRSLITCSQEVIARTRIAVAVSAGRTAGGAGTQMPTRPSAQPWSCWRVSPRMSTAPCAVAATAGSAANRRTAAVAVTIGLSARRCITERIAVSRESSRVTFHPVTSTSRREWPALTSAAVYPARPSAPEASQAAPRSGKLIRTPSGVRTAWTPASLPAARVQMARMCAGSRPAG